MGNKETSKPEGVFTVESLEQLMKNSSYGRPNILFVPANLKKYWSALGHTYNCIFLEEEIPASIEERNLDE